LGSELEETKDLIDANDRLIKASPDERKRILEGKNRRFSNIGQVSSRMGRQTDLESLPPKKIMKHSVVVSPVGRGSPSPSKPAKQVRI